MIMRLAKSLVRRALKSRGYYIGAFRFGLDYMHDVYRLSQAWRIPIRTFFDVGANQGQTSVSALATFEDARIFAFEPHPRTFSELQGRLGHNPRFSAYEVALGDVTRSAATLFEYQLSAVNSLVPDAQHAVRFRQASRKIEVRCVTLDDFCEAHRVYGIDVLKIDTEGCDLVVLHGAHRMLSTRSVRFLCTEFNDMLPKPETTGGALVPVSEFLGPFGFRFVAAYTDFVVTEGEMFTVANALFALPPGV